MTIEILINMLYIAVFIACFEISGFMRTTESIINEKRKMNGKLGTFKWGYPLGCNLCQCFWCEVAYVLICGPISLLTLTLCILFALSQRVLVAAIEFIYDTLETIFIKLNNRING